jgi:hypothetical protein
LRGAVGPEVRTGRPRYDPRIAGCEKGQTEVAAARQQDRRAVARPTDEPHQPSAGLRPRERAGRREAAATTGGRVDPGQRHPNRAAARDPDDEDVAGRCRDDSGAHGRRAPRMRRADGCGGEHAPQDEPRARPAAHPSTVGRFQRRRKIGRWTGDTGPAVRCMIYVSVALASVAAFLGAAATAPAALTPARLLARYQPVVVLHPAERFAPVSVTPFLRAATLEQRGGDGTWTGVGAGSSPLPAADPANCTSTDTAPCWRLRDARCSAGVGVASVACFADVDAEARRPAMYGAVHRRGNRIALQYWLWYRYDFWSGRYPPDDFVWQAHEGDWELVTVLLTARGAPLFVGLSQHGCGKRRTWSRVPKQGGTHPVAFAALGSHANYFSPGRQAIDLSRECYSALGAAVLRAFLHPPEELTGRGRRFGPRLPGITRALLVRITATSPDWMRFPGRWGETNWFHAPNPVNTVNGGPAPDGPAFHATWRDPVAVPGRWRRG